MLKIARLGPAMHFLGPIFWKCPNLGEYNAHEVPYLLLLLNEFA
jgi:hypothetical protein